VQRPLTDEKISLVDRAYIHRLADQKHRAASEGLTHGTV